MDNFITGGNEISSTSYSSDYNFSKDFSDKQIVPTAIEPIEELDCPDATLRLKFYSIAHNGFMIVGGLSVIGVAAGAILAKDNSMDHSIFALLLFAIAMFAIGLTAKYVGASRFRSLAVSKSLESCFDNAVYVNERNYMTKGIFGSVGEIPSPDSDPLHELSPQECVKYLNIGGNQWNRGIVQNELKATHRGMEFHYFDATMEYIINKKTAPLPCFIGQIYIFKCNSDAPVDVFFIPDSDPTVPQKLSNYPDFFNSMFYNEKTDPFVTRHEGIIESVKGLFTKEEQAEAQSLIETMGGKNDLQSPEFMECLLRLKRILADKKWGIRVKNGYIILYIDRRKNMFEFSFGKTDKAMNNLCKEINEMRSIVDCFSEYSLAKSRVQS